MVSIREVDYKGLLVRVEPTEDKPFFLTGETTDFRIKITNLEDNKREGKLSIRWRYGFGFGMPFHAIPVEIDLEPKETKEFLLTTEWHRYEGSVICCIDEIGMPEDHKNMSTDEFHKKIKSESPEFYVLCTYKVMDKTTYEEERKRYETLLKEQKDLRESIEKLREDITKIAREEARREVLQRLALGFKIAFTQEIPEEEKEEEPKSYHG
ncbi:MAG: hypothetical protein H3Z52_12440 [archaeon]|nr:hypothetical protein [archaeon]MCP8321728.1 hypothetical protein [archaeon]